MPLRSASTTLGFGSSTSTLAPWAGLASIDIEAARARARARREARRGPSVAELTESQYSSATKLSYVAHNWRALGKDVTRTRFSFRLNGRRPSVLNSTRPRKSKDEEDDDEDDDEEEEDEEDED